MRTKYDVEFYFGVRPVSTFYLYVTAIFLSLAVSLISHYTKADKKNLWRIIDEIGKQYRIRVINKLIISVPELLTGRIDSEIDKAIIEYNSEVKKEEPKIIPIFTEVKDGETPLGGEMRIQSPWNKKTD
jgi:hypothetical protein